MDSSQILRELSFKSARSSGPGGQHVNKTESKVEVSLDIRKSQGLSEDEKDLLLKNLINRINKDGIISIQCSETRSQHKNKAIVIDRLFQLLESNIKIAKKRKKTKPSRKANEKRLQTKKDHSKKKANRKAPKPDE